MVTSSALLLLLLSLLPISIASSHNLRLSTDELAAIEGAAPPPRHEPSSFFEVDRPVRPPRGSRGPCSTLLLSHSFASTFTEPPVAAAYSPPRCLLAAGGRAEAISLAVLEWRAACRGFQLDRVYGVWLGGAELLRGCTAEPRRGGVAWAVSKDVSRYASLLAAGNSTLAVYLGNLVDDTYTGIYHANLTLHLYFRRGRSMPPPATAKATATAPADLIIPISRRLPSSGGLWFEIENSTDVVSVRLAVPRNAYRAVLEVYVSFHSLDEFWYMNTPDSNGTFREVTAAIDGGIVGAVWPFPVIYTGGVNPLLWRPVTGIASFDFPTYDIEVTPFLGKILDGEEHEFVFAVTNALSAWHVGANLHLWLDPESAVTTGGLLSYAAPPLAASTASLIDGVDGWFSTTASRRIAAAGWVNSSRGNITTACTQTLNYTNTNAVSGNGSAQAINQTTEATSDVDAAAAPYSQRVHQSFPLYVYMGFRNRSTPGGAPYTLVRSVELGFDETRVAAGGRSSSLRDAQAVHADVEMRDDAVAGVAWRGHQVYRYEAGDGCYFRDVSSRDYEVLFDHSDGACGNSSSAADGAGHGGSYAKLSGR